MTGTNTAVQRAALVAMLALLTACGDRTESTETAPEPAADSAPAPSTDASEAGAPALEASLPAGVPPFAAPYPGARLDGPAVTSQNETERGGMISFTTPDHPDAVVDFYRTRAEASGLASAMTMTQGDTLVFGAQAEGVGASVQVVATPVDGATSVQLTWSSGG